MDKIIGNDLNAYLGSYHLLRTERRGKSIGFKKLNCLRTNKIGANEVNIFCLIY